MNLIERATNIVLKPKSEWQVIAEEPATAGELYRGYVMPLAAIGPVAQFIGMSLIGVSLPFMGSYHVPLIWGLSQAVVQYALVLVGIYLISLIVNGLAPSFGGEKNPIQALKVAVYAYTPAWIAAILLILPMLGILVLLASLYGLYLLYLGLPSLMKSPPDKAAGYTAVVVLCSIVVMAAIGIVAGAVGGMGMGAARLAGGMAGPMSGISSGRSDQLNQMAAQIHSATEQMEAAKRSGNPQEQASAAANAFGAMVGGGAQVSAVDKDILKAMLPDTAGGLPRTNLEASKGGMGGLEISTAKARYDNGQGNAIDLTITDAGGAKMMMAAWAMIEQDRETPTGYEKMGKVEGRPTHEVFDKNGPHGEYATLVGDRFLVQANGSKVDMDAIKQAVATVDFGKLEAMKNEGVNAKAK